MLEWIKSSLRPSPEAKPEAPDWRQVVKKHLKSIKATKAQYKTVLELVEFVIYWGDHFAIDLGWYEDEEDIKLLKLTLFDRSFKGEKTLVLSIEDDGNVVEYPSDEKFSSDPLLEAKIRLGVFANG